MPKTQARTKSAETTAKIPRKQTDKKMTNDELYKLVNAQNQQIADLKTQHENFQKEQNQQIAELTKQNENFQSDYSKKCESDAKTFAGYDEKISKFELGFSFGESDGGNGDEHASRLSAIEEVIFPKQEQ